MKKKFGVIVSVIVFSLAFQSEIQSVFADTGIATLQNIEGDVSVHLSTADANTWEPATDAMNLNSGDGVRTGAQGSCTVAYSNQATFALTSNTTITLSEKPETQDISLSLGRLKAMVNKNAVIKPFQVVTPTAIGAVRGTEADFELTPGEGNQFGVDLLEGGPVQVYSSETDFNLDVEGKKKINVSYKDGSLTVACDCKSDGPITFDVQGSSYTVDPCKSATIKVKQTAAEGLGVPDDTPGGNLGDETTPNEQSGDNDDNPPAPSSSPSRGKGGGGLPPFGSGGGGGGE